MFAPTSKHYDRTTVMRTMLVIFALLAARTAASAGSSLPISFDYPWCVYGGELGFSGDCSYETREQCLASASGRSNVICKENRRLLFKQQQAAPQHSVQQPRAHRRN
jgi:Protein of unknown function (DUF3551)